MDSNLHDFLSLNLERLLRKNKIQKERDFSRVKGIHSNGFFLPIQKRLAKLSFVRNVRFRLRQHSCASSYLIVQFRNKTLGGIDIHISHLAPIFYWYSLPPEGFLGPIDWSMSAATINKILLNYDKAKKAFDRNPPRKAKLFADQILDELTVDGLMCVPRGVFEKRPSPAANFPKALRRYSLAFFYFHSIPLFTRKLPRIQRSKVHPAKPGRIAPRPR